MSNRTSEEHTTVSGAVGRPKQYLALGILEISLIVAAIYVAHSIAGDYTAGLASVRLWNSRVATHGRLADFGTEVAWSARQAVGQPDEGLDGAALQVGLGRLGEQLTSAQERLQDTAGLAEVDRIEAERLVGSFDEIAASLRAFTAKVWVASADEQSVEGAAARASLREVNLAAAHLQDRLAGLRRASQSALIAAIERHERLSSDWSASARGLIGVALVLALVASIHAWRLFRDRRAAIAAIESAAESQDAFLSNVNHAIRTPMNAIVGMTDLVLETSLTRDQRYALEEARSSSASLLATVNNILDFSMIKARRLVLSDVPFEVRSTVYNAVGTMASRAYRKGLEIVWSVAPEVPDMVRGDAGHLQQVLTSLLDNAITHTDHGEIEIRVRHQANTTEGLVLDCEVRDSGAGIPASQQEVVFSALRTGISIDRRVRTGVGLGLATSAELVEIMGGEMSVTSAVGQGTSFRFTVALGQCDASGDSVGVARPVLRGRRVLVVEECDAQACFLRGVIRGFRATVSRAAGPEDARSRIRAAAAEGRAFHAVVLGGDVHSSESIELASELSSESQGGRVGVVALVTSDRRDDVADLASAGIRERILKPVRPGDLSAALQRVTADESVNGADSQGSGVGRGREGDVRSLRVLLADDNPVDRTLGARLLEKRGHAVSTVSDGDKALAALEDASFDVVLLDVQMPGRGGLEVAEQIRAQEKISGTRIPIIALTAQDAGGRCLEAGMDSVVMKPVDGHLLSEVMLRLLPSDPVDEVDGRDRPLDERAALDRASGDRTLLGDMAETFLEDCAPAVARLHEAVEQGNATNLRSTAQRLRVSLQALEAEPASELARRLERMGHEGALDHARDSLVRLEEELRRVRPSLVRLATGSAASRPTANG